MHSAFRFLLGAEVVSNFGAMLSRLAIPWLAALTLDVTPFEMGFLLVADVVAGAAGSLALGAVVDRMDKRAVMIGADIAHALVLGLLAILAIRDSLAFPMLVAAAAASGIMTVMFELARSAWIAQRVPLEELTSRNAQMSMGTSLSETVAFAIGGWIYQAMGAVIALVVDAASYVVSALLVRNVPAAPAVRVEATSSRRLRAVADDIREGLGAIKATPVLRMLAAVEVLVALAMSIAGTSYMIFVARDIGFETGTLGLIFATGGIGSLAGAWIAPRLGARRGVRGAMLAGLALLAIGAFCIPLAPGATILGAALLVAHQVVGDGGYNIYDVHDRTLRQAAVAPHLLARVDSGIRTLGQLARLAGAVGGGLIATAIGTRSALALSAAIYVVAFLVVARSGRIQARAGRYPGV